MRKTAAIVVGILVGASCIPWLRHQHFFSVLGGVITVALFGLLVFGGLRAISVWWRQIAIEPGRKQFNWWSPKLCVRLLAAAIILALGFPIVHFAGTSSSVYTLAVTTARQTPQFNEVLGAPVREGWFPEFKFTFGEPGSAKLLIPERGQLRRGNLRVLAIKENGRWRLQELTLELAQPEQRIDLLMNARQPDGSKSAHEFRIQMFGAKYDSRCSERRCWMPGWRM